MHGIKSDNVPLTYLPHGSTARVSLKLQNVELPFESVHALLTGSTRRCTADAPFWQHPGHLVFLPAVPARFNEVQVPPQLQMEALPAAAAGTSFAPKTPKTSEEDAPQNQLGARERNPSVVQLLEQPTIYRGSSLWCAPLQPNAISALSIAILRACLCNASVRLWSGFCMTDMQAV